VSVVLIPILHRVCNWVCAVGFCIVFSQLLWGVVGCVLREAVLSCWEQGVCILLN